MRTLFSATDFLINDLRLLHWNSIFIAARLLYALLNICTKLLKCDLCDILNETQLAKVV